MFYCRKKKMKKKEVEKENTAGNIPVPKAPAAVMGVGKGS